MNIEILNRVMNRTMIVGGFIGVTAFIYQSVTTFDFAAHPEVVGIMAILGVLAVALTIQSKDFV